MEELKLPNEVIDSDWRDDVDFEIMGGDEQREREYIAPVTISMQSIKRIKELRQKQKLNIFDQNEKMAA